MKRIITLLSIFFLFPLSVFAENKVKVECPSEILKNQETTCVVKATTEYEVVSVELNYNLPEGIELKSSEINSSWEGKTKENSFYLYTNKAKNKEFELGTITIKSNKDIKNIELEITKLVLGDSNFNEHTVIDKSNTVNKVEKESKKEEEEKNNIFKYVIIILIIGTIVVGFLIYIKTRSGKNEK